MDCEHATPRVYGCYPDDPHPWPERGHVYRELVGGPLDGLLLDVTGMSDEDIAEGAYLIAETGVHGSGGRTAYGPRGGDPASSWAWEGDVP
ncbi:hypothetical protein EYS09_03870 [Streptomyces kasugaensis]|uniref:Uncharacterized protein n=1 Tax=Streptomyces kasugaensis TaxID=1946 RepID=A0A4Q9I009_STRKA|nr:hypothetical protein [Streptomyces kasugaensis]TBO60916.1 hypothetical protein EYS09_03870 [Streptomyces kasugaensis]